MSVTLILAIFHIYFIYAAVSVSRELALLQDGLSDIEFVYQEAVRTRQSVMARYEHEYMEFGGYSRTKNPEFASRVSSLVLR